MVQRQIFSAGSQGIFQGRSRRPGSAAGILSFRSITFLCLLFFVSTPLLQALDVPPLTSRIMDQVGVLSSAVVSDLEVGLEHLEAEDGTQIAVLVIPTLDGENPEEYALRTAETWKLGQAGEDNGALLLIAIDDRVMRIEVGYGLEDRLTDIMAGRIITERIAPAFRKGDVDGGVRAGVEAMSSAARGENPFAADPSNASAQTGAGIEDAEKDIKSESNTLTGDDYALIAIVVLSAAAGFFLRFFSGGVLFHLAVASGLGAVIGLGAGLLSGVPWATLLIWAAVGVICALAGRYGVGGGSEDGRRSSRSGGGGFRGGGGGFGGGGASGRW